MLKKAASLFKFGIIVVPFCCFFKKKIYFLNFDSKTFMLKRLTIMRLRFIKCSPKWMFSIKSVINPQNPLVYARIFHYQGVFDNHPRFTKKTIIAEK